MALEALLTESTGGVSKTGDPRFKRRSRITVAGDQQSCFVADETGQIWEYDFDGPSGSIANRRLFANTLDQPG